MKLRSAIPLRPAGWHHWIARNYLGKPDQGELLRIKFPTLRSVMNAGLNELAYRAGSLRSYRLTSLNVEVTNHCNLRCTICPVNRGMERKKRFIDPALFRKVIDATPSLEFILPFQWGEPLLHPEIGGMIRYAAARRLRVFLTTNGTLLDEERCEELCTSGLTRLTISIDGNEGTHAEIRDVPLQEIRERTAVLRRIRDRLRSPMRIDVSMVLDTETRAAYAEYLEEWCNLVDRVQAIPRLDSSERHTRCRELWRGTLVVLADGRVTPCCPDFEGKLAIGSARESSPDEIFRGGAMRRLREAHVSGCFPEICRFCGEYDARDLGVSYRFR
ncbi:MAG: radical SAM protein [Planctomycetota bacterium]